MGLDMYLNRYPKSMTAEERNKKSEDLWNEGIEAWREKWKNKVSVAYWRKVNFLHGWIVNNLADGVDECQEIEVSLDDITEILDLCEKSIAVLEEHDLVPQRQIDKSKWKYEWEPEFEVDPDKPRVKIKWDDGEIKGLDDSTYYKVDTNANGELDEFLPPTSGFFFGSYFYDTWYVYDMYRLRDTLQSIIHNWDDGFQYIYQASW